MSYFCNTSNISQESQLHLITKASQVASKKWRMSKFLFAAAAITGLLSGCATLQPESAPVVVDWTQRAQNRAVERWKFIAEKQYAKAYAYLSPASRSLITPDSFERTMANFGARGATASSAICEQSVCSVQLVLTVANRIPRVGVREMSIPHTESWLIVDGEIWFVQK